MMNKSKVLFLGKRDDIYVQKALNICISSFKEVESHMSDWDGKLPEKAVGWNGDYIISYLCRWIVPKKLLKRARIAAINFHPAPPSYPGVGCCNFALYDGVKEYGVTCHHMSDNVDTGDIILVDRFKIYNNDSVSTLLTRAYDHQIILFYKIINLILDGQLLPKSSEKWGRKPLTSKDLYDLRKISPGMSLEEVLRRIRATAFNEWKPFISLYGLNFELKQ